MGNGNDRGNEKIIIPRLPTDQDKVRIALIDPNTPYYGKVAQSVRKIRTQEIYPQLLYFDRIGILKSVIPDGEIPKIRTEEYDDYNEYPGNAYLANPTRLAKRSVVFEAGWDQNYLAERTLIITNVTACSTLQRGALEFANSLRSREEGLNLILPQRLLGASEADLVSVPMICCEFADCLPAPKRETSLEDMITFRGETADLRNRFWNDISALGQPTLVRHHNNPQGVFRDLFLETVEEYQTFGKERDWGRFACNMMIAVAASADLVSAFSLSPTLASVVVPGICLTGSIGITMLDVRMSSHAAENLAGPILLKSATQFVKNQP